MDARLVLDTALDAGLVCKGTITYNDIREMWIRDFHYLRQRVTERVKQLYGGSSNGE